MSIRVVRLGTDRSKGEGLRLGTVRRPPRGVKKERLANGNWYDVWLPQLSPSADLVQQAQAATTPKQWAAFAKKYRREMSAPDNARLIALLAALSHDSNFAVGCYCADENHCHRSVLREILRENGAKLA
ncbi:MAG TPA: DUF488 family protein [Thermoanaerobaculia bacterium]|jgi:uncharacterized protein YeaO (DUF488 family)